MIVLDESGTTSIWGKESKTILKEAKRYLKTDFKSHVGPEERCLDHCTAYSLSDPHNDTFTQHCDHTHEMSCSSCSHLDEVASYVMRMINSPKLTVTDEQKSQVTFDETHAVEATLIGKPICCELSTKSNDQSVLVIMDWAMKYLPQQYREQMSDFYGKR